VDLKQILDKVIVELSKFQVQTAVLMAQSLLEAALAAAARLPAPSPTAAAAAAAAALSAGGAALLQGNVTMELASLQIKLREPVRRRRGSAVGR
jgi:hypothetical protein